MIKAEDYFKIDEKEREKMRHKFIVKAKKVYQKLIEPNLNETDFGKFVAVEPETKSYFIGITGREAIDKAEERFPDKSFYLARVGFKAAYSFGGLRVKHQR
jgi:hypothetical protein